MIRQDTTRQDMTGLDLIRRGMTRQDKIYFKTKIKNMKTIAEVAQETLQIEEYLKTISAGEKIKYTTIQAATGVKMGNKGKGYMRSALNRLKLEYSAIRGWGIELCSATNATSMIAHKVIRIDNAVKKATKTTKRVSDQFFDELSQPERLHVTTLRSIFSYMHDYAKNAKLIFREQPRSIN